MRPTLNPMRRHHERCGRVREQMSDCLDGELDPHAMGTVTRHTRICPNCRRMLDNLARTVSGLRALHDLPSAGGVSHRRD